jgi:hypothetical protein
MVHCQGRLPPLESRSKSKRPTAPVGATGPPSRRGGFLIMDRDDQGLSAPGYEPLPRRGGFLIMDRDDQGLSAPGYEPLPLRGKIRVRLRLKPGSYLQHVP